MPESSNPNPSPSSWSASRERGRAAQTGSERGTFRYRHPHPTEPDLVFDYYRKRANGSFQEVWLSLEVMESRHAQRLAHNLARARARGVPPRRPAAPKAERLKKARVRQEKVRQKKRKQDTELSAEEDTARWEILAMSLGKTVEEIRHE